LTALKVDLDCEMRVFQLYIVEKMKSSAEKWDDGCKTNDVRNVFVIPKMIQLINELKPSRVLDIGTGTGYMAKCIDEKIEVDVEWTLIDQDADRIDFVNKNLPASVNFQALTTNFITDDVTRHRFDLVLLLFTLLELNLEVGLFSKIQRQTSDNGVVVITMPNILEDVLKAAVEEPSLLTDFAEGRCVLGKIDKFTGEAYPFKAHRFEDIVQLMLHSGFSLEKLYSYNQVEKETFMFVFKKTGKL